MASGIKCLCQGNFHHHSKLGGKRFVVSHKSHSDDAELSPIDRRRKGPKDGAAFFFLTFAAFPSFA